MKNLYLRYSLKTESSVVDSKRLEKTLINLEDISHILCSRIR